MINDIKKSATEERLRMDQQSQIVERKEQDGMNLKDIFKDLQFQIISNKRMENENKQIKMLYDDLLTLSYSQKQQLEDKQEQTDHLNRKNTKLEEEIKELNQFKPDMVYFKTKFKDISMEKVIENYFILEKTLFKMNE